MFFVVVGLIGTGWAFIKPILSQRDRTLFLIVLPLQVISNVALIIVEETAPGTRGWFAWISLLPLSISSLLLRVPPLTSLFFISLVYVCLISFAFAA